MAHPPIIALLTDFGTADQYVASMKAVILSINPQTNIVDVSHSVEPQNIDQAAYLLWSSYKYFPNGTIFVCVVDPGVGTSRKIVCVEGNGYRFLAPDNSILKYVLTEINERRTIGVTNEKYFRKEVSSTFQGRDIFAPVAAQLSKGLSPAELGKRTSLEFGAESFVRVQSTKKQPYAGRILHIDRFGNIITNYALENPLSQNFSLRIGRKRIRETSKTYGAAPSSKPFMILGSTGMLEVSVKNGNAAKRLRARLSQMVQLSIS